MWQSDKEVNQLISGSLKLHGLQVHSVYSHDQFIRQLEDLVGAVDVVFISGKLVSERGGFFVSRTKQSNPQIKVIVVAENGESDRAQVLSYGADEYIKKPVSSETISAKMLSLLAAENKVRSRS